MKNNLVAKYANKYNKSSVQEDKKKAKKKGKVKHKKEKYIDKETESE